MHLICHIMIQKNAIKLGDTVNRRFIDTDTLASQDVKKLLCFIPQKRCVSTYEFNQEFRDQDNLIVRSRTASNNIISGYVYIPYVKQNGTRRSCIQDAFINMANLYGVDLQGPIYHGVPPRLYTDTPVHEVMNLQCIKSKFTCIY